MPTPLSPFQSALDKFSKRTPSPSHLTSAQWAQLPTAIRERAFFSARIQNADFLGAAKDGISDLLNPRTVIREGRPVTEGANPATIRAELKTLLEELDYQPTRRGIEDLSSDQRLNLIINQNTEAAQGYGQHLQALESADIYPAQELYRLEDRNEPRDWPARWAEAGGQFYDGRMIALKGDPVWLGISAFDVPWPPFDFNSGMWVRDIDRDEARELGLPLPAHNTHYGFVSPSGSTQVTLAFNSSLGEYTQPDDPGIAQALRQSLTDLITGSLVSRLFG